MDALEDFVDGHRAHGDLFADASTPGPNGYRLEVSPGSQLLQLLLKRSPRVKRSSQSPVAPV